MSTKINYEERDNKIVEIHTREVVYDLKEIEGRISRLENSIGSITFIEYPKGDVDPDLLYCIDKVNNGRQVERELLEDEKTEKQELLKRLSRVSRR